MTTERQTGSARKFVPVILPWVVAGGGLVVYLLTLNHWVSLNSLLPVAKISGWTWQPEFAGPLCWLLTCPLRALPVHLVPLAVNLFSTVCAVLTLAVLARSVALLPQDRTQAQRDREKSPFGLLSIRSAWVPPVLAAVVCGLQLTFWENATSASGHAMDLIVSPFINPCEMLDLLLFAYVIRCLLEHRVQEKSGWLYRAAFVFGLAIPENWAMIGFLPVFVLAVAWTKGLGFFNARFLGVMTLWGLAGLSLFLLLPAWQSVTGSTAVPFVMALKTELGVERSALAVVYGLFSANKQDALLLALTSLVPIFLVSIRWTSSFGDNSPMGVWLSTFALGLAQAFFLLFCCWISLDPPLSPRNQAWLPMPCFTLAYLASLSIGYISGYFLLVFGKSPPRRGGSSSIRPIRALGRGAVWLLVILMPAALIYRNLPQVRLTNGPLLQQYAALQTQTLPPRGAAVLSDDPRQLTLVESYLEQLGRGDDYLFVDTGFLRSPDYERFLKKKYGTRWPINISKEMSQTVPDLTLIRLISTLSATNQIFYLHPSFGYYFEIFQQEPHGMNYKLSPCPTNTLLAMPVSKEVAEENETFWAKADGAVLAELVPLMAPAARAKDKGGLEWCMARLHLERESNPGAALVAEFCSRDRNYWGVEEQVRGELRQAGGHFRRALELHPANLPAQVNLECNQSLQAGKPIQSMSSKMVEEAFGPYRRWERIVADNGPFDEPSFCYHLGDVCSQGKLYRQAAQEFARVRVLAPGNLRARLGLAKMDILRALPDEALATLAEIHSQSELVGLSRTNLPEVLLVEAAAHLSKRDVAGAESAVRAALDQYPGDENLLVTAARAYLNYGVYSNAVACLKTAVQKDPDNQNLLMFAGQAYGSAGMPQEAIASIESALAKHSAKDADRETMLETAGQIYLGAGLLTNALSVLNEEISLNPENPQALANKGYALLQLGSYDPAIAALTQAVEMEKNNTPTLRSYAKYNRAIAYLRAERLNESEQDYRALIGIWPSSYQIYYGLQEIAYRKKDVQTAARYCRLYLANAPNNTEEAKGIAARLKELKPGSP